MKDIINITNTCLELSHWPSHFKISTTIIISKPNKVSYDSSKSFRPIIILNILEKLIEKVIGDRLQFHLISNNFIYQYQLGSLKFKIIPNTSIMLTHFIYTEWIRNLTTSTLAFNISQFFSSLNHHLLPCILGKAGFDPKVVHFFSNYLVGKKTQYFWNSFSSPLFNVDVRVGQDSALSPILSAFYLALIFHILENHLKILKIPVSILFFINDGLFIAQGKFFSLSNSLLFYSYNIASNLLLKFGLTIKHSKTEVFYFSRLFGAFNPSPLDLSILGGPILYPKKT